MRRTHAAAGLALGFGLAAHQQAPLLTGVLIALVSQAASLVPDLDLKLKIKHRGLTHSLLALVVIGLLIAELVPVLLVPILAGYASHLLLDLLTVQGIELFYPSHRRIRLLRFRTNSRVDHLMGAALLCAALVVLLSLVTQSRFTS